MGRVKKRSDGGYVRGFHPPLEGGAHQPWTSAAQARYNSTPNALGNWETGKLGSFAHISASARERLSNLLLLRAMASWPGEWSWRISVSLYLVSLYLDSRSRRRFHTRLPTLPCSNTSPSLFSTSEGRWRQAQISFSEFLLE